MYTLCPPIIDAIIEKPSWEWWRTVRLWAFYWRTSSTLPLRPAGGGRPCVGVQLVQRVTGHSLLMQPRSLPVTRVWRSRDRPWQVHAACTPPSSSNAPHLCVRTCLNACAQSTRCSCQHAHALVQVFIGATECGVIDCTFTSLRVLYRGTAPVTGAGVKVQVRGHMQVDADDSPWAVAGRQTQTGRAGRGTACLAAPAQAARAVCEVGAVSREPASVHARFQ